jgi:hypothetical protein
MGYQWDASILARSGVRQEWTRVREMSVERDDELGAKGKRIKRELDELLDRIAPILDENAEEFLKHLTLGGPREREPDGYQR